MKGRSALLTIVLFILVFGCQGRQNTPVPDSLIGVWQTSMPKYADRCFEITGDSLIFEYGEGYFNFNTYPIVKVERIQQNARLLYIITYMTGEGLEYEFSFYYDPQSNEAIEFKNQQGLKWRKKNLSNWPPGG